MGRRLGIDRGTWHRWEIGQTRPDDPKVVGRIAQYFKLDIDMALDAADLRPEGAEPPPEPLPPMDPDLRLLVQILVDPDTDEATRAFIKRSLQMLAAAAEQGDPPRPNRRAG